MKSVFLILIAFMIPMLFACPVICLAEEAGTISLPAPHMEGGMPLMQALKERQSLRSYEEKMLPDQMLSDLLWAGFGINRPEKGLRTAPSAANWQDLDIYVATAKGIFLYDAANNTIVRTVEKDLRELTGMQPFVKTAPVNLIYVSDYAKLKGDESSKRFLAGVHTGCVSQNVSLFCASEGLSTVVRASADRDTLAKELGLKPDQRITLLQTVGFPKK